jgi:hypothetical protein
MRYVMAEMNDTKSPQATKPEQREPPMPRVIFRVANPLMKALLLSPFHGGMSGRLMVITFTGRKSGKKYSTPVGYVRDGSEIYVFTSSPWRLNFKDWAPVSMRIRGKDVQGTARIATDPVIIKRMIQTLTAAHGDDLSKRMGFYVENLDTASPEDVMQATRGTYFLEIKTPGAGENR